MIELRWGGVYYVSPCKSVLPDAFMDWWINPSSCLPELCVLPCMFGHHVWLQFNLKVYGLSYSVSRVSLNVRL